MVRLPDADRADVRLAEGRLRNVDIERIAVHVAAFHEDARSDEETARYGTVAAMDLNVRENFEQTRASVSAHLAQGEVEEVEAWQTRFLEEHAELFEERIRAGRVRDGHGDMRVEHIYLGGEGRVTILDCIEFNERFRFIDVCADVAFLSMGLAWHDRSDLAEHFLALYAREANDYDLYPLVDFYQSYRAYVRGKIASMLASDPDVATAVRERAAEEARRYFLLALASGRRPLVPPTVVAVGGIVATGKTTVADRLGAEMSAPVVSSDRTRKSLLGVGPTESLRGPAWEEAYEPAMTEKVYAELFRRAGAVARSGRPVVLDASFRTRGHREISRQMARDLGARFFFVECRAPAEVCRERLGRRTSDVGASDAREDMFDDFVAKWEPVEELAESEHVILDTSEPIETNVELPFSRMLTWHQGPPRAFSGPYLPSSPT
jgi:predicted kinase